MKTKKADKPYCGVDHKVIQNAEPTLNWENVYHLKRFIIDRYKIHVRKDVKEMAAPWTNNPILREYRFTNVRREHDRQTQYLIHNISNNLTMTLEDKIVNTFMFRAWNNWATLKDLGFPYPATMLYNPKLKDKLKPRYYHLLDADPDRLWYNNAYNQGGTKQAWRSQYKDMQPEVDIPMRPFHVGVWLGKQKIVKKLLDAKDQQEAFEIIKSVRGFADFLAYQVFVDLTYIKEFPFSENEFTIAGPGCKRGLDYIFIDRDGMTYEECLFWLRDQINAGELFKDIHTAAIEEENNYPHRVYNPEKLFIDLPEYDRCMNVMSLENCMCELSKYIRAVDGTGRPKNKYKPFKEEK